MTFVLPPTCFPGALMAFSAEITPRMFRVRARTVTPSMPGRWYADQLMPQYMAHSFESRNTIFTIITVTSSSHKIGTHHPR